MTKKFIHIICLLALCLNSNSQELRDTVLKCNVHFIINAVETVSGDEGYDKFIGKMLPFMYEHVANLDKVTILGSASPDGPYDLNERLAKERMQKIVSYFFIKPDKIETSYLVQSHESILTTDRRSIDSIYREMRSAYVEMRFSHKEPIKPDTVYIVKLDTIYKYDTLYVSSGREKERIPVIGIKTNMVSDAVLAPNVQVEFYTHFSNLSMEFAYTFPWWSNDDKFLYYQMLNGTVGIRQYLNSNYSGHWFGIYGNSNIYDFCYTKEKGWQGESWGVGVSYGYAFRSQRHEHLKIEPYIRVGYIQSKYDEYYAGVPFSKKYYYNWDGNINDFIPRRLGMKYFGPTMGGVNITFDIKKILKHINS